MAVGVCAQTFIRSAAFRGAASFQGTAATNEPAAPVYDGPIWVANGSVASATTGSGTPGLPTGYQADDIFIMFIESANDKVSQAAPTGYNIVTNTSNMTNGFSGAGIAGATQLEVFWKRAIASETAVAMADRGDHSIGIVMCIRGAETNGYPFDVAQSAFKGVTNTVTSITNGTTTVSNVLVIAACTDMADSAGTTRWDSWYNDSLGGLTERIDTGGTSGNGGGIGAATGYMTNAGTFTVTTNVGANSSVNAYWALGLKKPQAVAPAITVQPTSIVAVTNTVETFTVTATGNPAVAYQWNYAGANISGATGSSFATNSFPTATAQTNNVFCVITNSFGSVTSSVVTAAWTNGVPAGDGPVLYSHGGSDFTDLALRDTTTSVSWQNGNWVVALGVAENSALALSVPTNTSLGTFVAFASLGETADCAVQAWSVRATSSGSGTISAETAGNVRAGLYVFVFDGTTVTNGVVTTASPGADIKTISLARATANSMVIEILGEYNAVVDASIAATPSSGGTIHKQYNDGASYGAYVLSWTDQGAATTTPYGITNFTGTVDMNGIVIEIKK